MINLTPDTTAVLLVLVVLCTIAPFIILSWKLSKAPFITDGIKQRTVLVLWFTGGWVLGVFFASLVIRLAEKCLFL